MQLTKKVDVLQEKNKQLEELLVAKTPAIANQYTAIVPAGRIDEAYEENICKMELKKLHDLSVERALTYEETKKVDIFTKLLISINQRPKGQLLDTKKKETSELLRLVGNEDDTENNGSE